MVCGRCHTPAQKSLDNNNDTLQKWIYNSGMCRTETGKGGGEDPQGTCKGSDQAVLHYFQGEKRRMRKC